MGANAALLGAYEAIDEKKSATSEKKSLMAERFQKRRTRDAPTQEHRRFRPQKIMYVVERDLEGAYSRGFRLLTRNGKSRREMVFFKSSQDAWRKPSETI